MRSSSEKIGALAAALAKAQSEIANPEKSLTATIVSPFPREGCRTYRYASLSSGLDLVRKCLGQHEIAVVQATALDKDRDLIRLSTSLVHSSGEWVSSDWPVCPVSETAVPHRLGAALTYARRYALFTLVGIAGEDDLDAPDLPAISAEAQNAAPISHLDPNRLNQPAAKSAGSLLAAEKRARAEKNRRPTLPPDASKSILHQLTSELAQLGDAEALAAWAHRILPLKNQLSQENAQTVEVGFAAKLNALSEATPELLSVREANEGEGGGVDRVMTINKPVRERDRNHLRFVATQPCLVCGRIPSDAHHLKFAEQPAMGRKVSDKFTVPVCRLHHRDLHKRGNECSWWQAQGIDPLPVAANLWLTSHSDASSVENANHVDRARKLNGKHLSDGRLIRHRNNETKPILGPLTK